MLLLKEIQVQKEDNSWPKIALDTWRVGRASMARSTDLAHLQGDSGETSNARARAAYDFSRRPRSRAAAANC